MFRLIFLRASVLPTTSPIEFLQQIECLGLFEAQRIVAEDVNRQKFYEDNRRRATLEGRFRTHEEFLKNLKMVSVMSGASSSAIKRLSSLSLKTNQFNLTQIGLSPDQVLEYDKHPKMDPSCGTKLTFLALMG